jgi:glutaredoxin
MHAKINTLPDCPWCERAKALMTALGIKYTEVQGKVDNWPTVPYIEIDGEPIGGFSEFSKFCRNLK